MTDRNWLERQIDTAIDDGIVPLVADGIEVVEAVPGQACSFLADILTDAAKSMVPHSWRGR